MTKFDYYVKQVKPDDLKYHLRLAGNTGWELAQIIILQRTTSFTLGQMPKIEILYEVIMKRESRKQLENGEIEQEITENEGTLKITEDGIEDYKKRLKK